MDLPLLTLLIACLGFFFGFFPLIVESQQYPKHPPPHILHPPPPPPLLSPSPPPSPFPTAPPLPSASQWLPHPFPRPPLPPSKKRLWPSPPKSATSKHRDHKHQDSLKNSTQAKKKKKKLNEGEIIGLIFVGVIVILQVCVVSFVLISRRQHYKGQSWTT